MKQYFFLIGWIFSLACFGQEICNNGIDDDGDTFIDCDDPDCQGPESIFPIIENFDGGTFDNPNWVSSGSAYINSGWLTLTDDLGGQSGSAFLNTAFVSTNHIIIEFDYATVNYNGDNCFYGIGDGMSFYLTLGSAGPSTGEPGAALGYSHGVSGDPFRGVQGGYLGIGLDEFGSFSGTNAAPSTCTELGSDAVTIRGMQTNDNFTAYTCLGTTLLPGNADVDVASRSEARRVRILLSPGGVLDLFMNLNDGNGLQPVFSNLMTGQLVPPTFKLGFSASTGGACIAHEIDNVVVAKPADIEMHVAAPANFNICDGALEYTVTAINHGPNDVSQIYLQDELSTALNDVSWTCDGCGVSSGSGNSLVNVPVDMNVGDTVVLTIQGSVSASAVGDTILNFAGIDFACTDFISSDLNNSMAMAATIISQTAIDPDLGTDTNICEFPFLLDAAVPNGSYSWQDGSAASTYFVSNAGIYWVDVESGACVERDSIIVYDISFFLDLGPDRNLCNGPVILDATTAGGSYLWQDGSSDAMYDVPGAGIYWVDVSVGGCTLRDSLRVEDASFQVDLGADQSLCNNTVLLDASQPGATYLWSDGSTGATLTTGIGGTYWVRVTIGNCQDTDTLRIDDRSFAISLGPDRTICEDLEILDATTPGASYLWQDSSTASTFTVVQSGNYSVEATRDDCSTSAAVQLTFEDCSVCRYDVPTAFSPNGDGFNDLFFAFFSCAVSDFEMEIFNRWGEKVYASDDPTGGWDGKQEGAHTPSDVFVWKIRYSDDASGQKLITGLVYVFQ